LTGNTPKSQQSNANGKHQSGASTSTQIQLPPPKRTLFPRENVQVGWNSIGQKWSQGCGFHNIGNTCYLNSALQAFFHVPALAQWLISDKDHREKGNCQGKLCNDHELTIY
jgi:ubiquitin carboxyl-terminal hydrolase 36/42